MSIAFVYTILHVFITVLDVVCYYLINFCSLFCLKSTSVHAVFTFFFCYLLPSLSPPPFLSPLPSGSVYSTDNNHLITNGGPLLSHVTNTSSRRGTPVLQLPVSNPNSPRVTGRQRSTLYPNLETSNRPQIM